MINLYTNFHFNMFICEENEQKQLVDRPTDIPTDRHTDSSQTICPSLFEGGHKYCISYKCTIPGKDLVLNQPLNFCIKLQVSCYISRDTKHKRFLKIDLKHFIIQLIMFKERFLITENENIFQQLKDTILNCYHFIEDFILFIVILSPTIRHNSSLVATPEIPL